jgi:hypothetical protein
MLGEKGGLARQAGEGVSSWYRTAEEVRHSQDDTSQRRPALHGTKAPLCTEYVSLCALCALTCCILDDCNHERCFTLSICFRRINHMAVKNHLHSSSGVQEVVSGTVLIYCVTHHVRVHKILMENKTRSSWVNW